MKKFNLNLASKTCNNKYIITPPLTPLKANKNTNLKDVSGVRILVEYGFYTLIIYLAILLTTHCELPYLLAFLSLLVVLFFKYLYDLFEYKGDPDVEDKIWNAGVLEYVAIGILLAGVVVYTMRQYADHSKNWNTVTFIFGKPKCGK
jgi:hypothetical protein